MRISSHAIVRYLERVEGLDTSLVRALLSSIITDSAYELSFKKKVNINLNEYVTIILKDGEISHITTRNVSKVSS